MPGLLAFKRLGRHLIPAGHQSVGLVGRECRLALAPGGTQHLMQAVQSRGGETHWLDTTNSLDVALIDLLIFVFRALQWSHHHARYVSTSTHLDPPKTRIQGTRVKELYNNGRGCLGITLSPES